MGVNNISLLNMKLFLLHGLSILVQQDIQFASVLLNDVSRSFVEKGQIKAGSTAFLDDTHKSYCQSHQDLIPNMLEPSIGLLFKSTLTVTRKLSRISVFRSRTYTIWTRRVVSGVVEREEHLESTFIHTLHV